MTDQIRVIEKPIPADEPFYGYRYRRVVDADGVDTMYITPLTEEDLKHPEEDDWIVQNRRHHRLFALLSAILPTRLAADPARYLGFDMLFDLGLANGDKVNPDVALVRGLEPPDLTVTVRVPAMAEAVELVIEITSPTTRHLDFGDRLERFHEGQIPRVIIIDAANPDETAIMGLQALEWTPTGYAPVPFDPPNRVLVDELDVWFCIEDNDLVIRDRDLAVIGDYAMVSQRAEQERQRAEQEHQRAEQERQRAEQEHQCAEQERERAERAEAAYQAILARAREQGISLHEDRD